MKILLITVSVLYIGLLLVLPLIFVLIQAFGNGLQDYLANITDEYTVKAVELTLLATVTALLVNTIFGLFAAWAVTKFQFRGKKVVTTMIDLPLSISPVIAGLIFILTFGRSSPLFDYFNQMNLKIAYAVPGVLLVTVFVTFPFISREIIPVLLAQGKDEEEAAALMGAGGFEIFRKITFPHIKWAMLYGVVLCTARAMGEFGAVSVISGNLRGKTNTIPLHVQILYNEFKYAPAFAVSSVLVVMAIIILVVRSIVEYRWKK
ncbi:MAG: sulfate ABC transporter permease subunit CysW [Lachnospiraceae bacterium]|nr:sulfate ABC transporter permease subunit CysW [Lachnospiraceae bacterium]